MAQNNPRSRGKPRNYKFDRGGIPAEFGPFTGVVMSTADPNRSGRLQVYIEAFSDGGPDAEKDPAKWITVSYMQQFGGSTPPGPAGGTTGSYGNYPGNQNSYGMWFTPPDVGITVLCVFVNGQRDQGYYIGTVPEEGLGSMLPAIGASSRYIIDDKNANQQQYFANSSLLPVTEINVNNNEVFNSPTFFNQQKPVHSYVAGVMFQQGLINDPERGPIRSSSQRETPSAVFGISTPGGPIYQGGMKPSDIRQKINDGSITPGQAQVIGRVGGHTLVMDDGDLEDNNQLFRLRTSKGHQITMSDDGDCFYITHANGQSWIELGSEGTVDIFSTNSVNVRTKGEINLHADKTINMYAGESFNIKSPIVNIEGAQKLALTSAGTLAIKSTAALSVNSDGSLSLSGSLASLKSDGPLVLKGRPIDLNGAIPAIPGLPTSGIQDVQLPDTIFRTNIGWEVEQGKITTIVSRAPTHEPYPYHNLGVPVSTTLSGATTDQTNTTLPTGFSISRDV